MLAERNPRSITSAEIFLFIWIAAFAYDEFGEFKDAGTLFYAVDFWSLWDIGIIGIGAAYLISSESLPSFTEQNSGFSYPARKKLEALATSRMMRVLWLR